VSMVVDLSLRLPSKLKLLNQQQPTIVFNQLKEEQNGNLHYLQITSGNLVEQLLKACHRLGLQSVLVEGGARLLQSFIDAGVWDEARIITNTTLNIGDGLAAPALNGKQHLYTHQLATDKIDYYTKISST
jgi:diaminohydroxyphosphoribosylaminopyrimidine deaminase/5-amino-6-(5-phosphoribosylamino)uracil reductase